MGGLISGAVPVWLSRLSSWACGMRLWFIDVAAAIANFTYVPPYGRAVIYQERVSRIPKYLLLTSGSTCQPL
jgi:hypothetical protein